MQNEHGQLCTWKKRCADCVVVWSGVPSAAAVFDGSEARYLELFFHCLWKSWSRNLMKSEYQRWSESVEYQNVSWLSKNVINFKPSWSETIWNWCAQKRRAFQLWAPLRRWSQTRPAWLESGSHKQCNHRPLQLATWKWLGQEIRKLLRCWDMLGLWLWPLTHLHAKASSLQQCGPFLPRVPSLVPKEPKANH